MTTILDIARPAGVSIATVSPVNNETARASGASRACVVGDHRHPLLPAWARAQPEDKREPRHRAHHRRRDEPVFGAVARTVGASLEAEGYALCNSDEDPAKEER